MRHLIHELPYETPLRAGLYRYERDGQATGAVEKWRLTAAPDGYRVLRVDLDARDAASGHSYLYHATLDPSGRLAQLKYRFWGAGHEVVGMVTAGDDAWTASRTVAGTRHEEEAPGRHAFWFPACAGLGLIVAGDGETLTGCTLDTRSLATPDAAAAAFALWCGSVRREPGAPEALTVAGEPVTARRCLVTWAWEGEDAEERALWLDEQDWPLRMQRQDGLAAVETQNIRWFAAGGR